MENPGIELSIVMPCLLKAETLSAYDRTGYESAKQTTIDECMIILSNRGNKVGSEEIARRKHAMAAELSI